MAKVKRRRTPGKTRGAAARADATMASDPVDAMMQLVESDGWRAVTFGRIATASGMSLSDLYSQYRSRSDLLVAYAARVDAAMLAALGPTPLAADGDVAKDRLFEAIMARLDAMAPHKAAIRVLMRELPRDPAALACFLYGGLRRSLDWVLAAADLDGAGLAGGLRRNLLGAVYLDTLRVWLRDDSEDLSETMSHLDRRLSRAMRWLTADRSFLRRRGHAADASAS
ncbi:MAG TPA: hypothetical protein VKZ87_01575 [Ferrovibrio sp.]|uniref:hypothetical protein n=1 Tax=Ferrovibrio sp. TaxID=1917215 RepID=UPI002B4B1F87|nr:hypothetical protein [Ferrovibrio sp.]HLT76049.1 hypothetical protein [Ferrovibrio sp.]